MLVWGLVFFFCGYRRASFRGNLISIGACVVFSYGLGLLAYGPGILSGESLISMIIWLLFLWPITWGVGRFFARQDQGRRDADQREKEFRASVGKDI